MHFTFPMLFGLSAWVICASGCAIHYHDNDTGVDHLWGFGHMKMKSEPTAYEGVSAVVTGVETVGIRIDVGEEYRGFGIGYDQRQKAVVQNDASVSMEWPDGSMARHPNLFSARFGVTPPWITNRNEKLSIIKSIKEIEHENQ